MAGEVDDLIIMYDSSVEITGRFHYKDELKIKEGSFGPCASFAILIEKPKKDKIAKHYIFARAYGEKIIEKLKRIEKGTFIRVIGELESGFGGTYVNVKVLTPVSVVELQDMLSRQKEPEEDLSDEILEELPDGEDLISEEEILETLKTDDPSKKENESDDLREEETDEFEREEPDRPYADKPEKSKPEKDGWSSGWKKKERRGIF